jgi:hypothetical protein
MMISNTHQPGSLYTSLQTQINDAASGKEFQDVLMAPSVYSQGVVANALKNKSKLWYWRGGNTWLVWGFTTFLWHLFPVSGDDRRIRGATM